MAGAACAGVSSAVAPETSARVDAPFESVLNYVVSAVIQHSVRPVSQLYAGLEFVLAGVTRLAEGWSVARGAQVLLLGSVLPAVLLHKHYGVPECFVGLQSPSRDISMAFQTVSTHRLQFLRVLCWYRIPR